MPPHRASETRSFPWMTGLIMIGLIALYGALLFNVARFSYNAWLSVLYPGELDYAEGIVWQQAKLIPGPRMYGDLQQYPFLVFHYPPLYHLVVNAAASLGGSWLAAGRVVSILSLVATAVLTGMFVMEATGHSADRPRASLDAVRYASLTAGVTAGLLIFSLDPLRLWARVARVDMLAGALEVFGMFLGLRALRRDGQLYGAAFVFVAALFTKQTVLMGAAATFVVALLHDWRRALRAGLAAALLGAAVFAALTIATDGGFPRHVILYNVNRFSLSYALAQFRVLSEQNVQPVYIVVAVAAFCALVVRGIMTGVRNLPVGAAIVAMYFALSTASLISLGKTGSNSNYFIPMACAITMLIGLAISHAAKWAASSSGYSIAFALLLTVLAMQSFHIPPVGEQRLVDPTLRRESAELVAMIHAAKKPVVSEDMVMLMQAGKEVPWEPAIIRELGTKGLFDEQKLIDLITAHRFAFVVENDTPDNSLRDARFSRNVLDAFNSAYPITKRLAGKLVLMTAY